MFGNSKTAQGEWSLKMRRSDVKNSGTGSYTTSQFIMILDRAVIKYNPRICFIEGGINDIGDGIPLTRTIQNYKSIVDTLLKYDIEPVLQSTIFTCLPNDSLDNVKVDSLNIFLKNLAISKNLEYIDLNEYLSENKRLKPEYTKDGIHLEENAYKIWVKEITKVLNRKKI
jgi:alpha-glucosidase